MSPTTSQSVALKALVAGRRAAVDEVLGRYGAVNPRLFGSVARGEATAESDLDLMVDLLPGGGNGLLRVAGLAEELTDLLGVRVDVVTAAMLRDEVSATAVIDLVAV